LIKFYYKKIIKGYIKSLLKLNVLCVIYYGLINLQLVLHVFFNYFECYTGII